MRQPIGPQDVSFRREIKPAIAQEIPYMADNVTSLFILV